MESCDQIEGRRRMVWDRAGVTARATARLGALVLGAALLQLQPAVASDRNACGCYSDGAGNCYCDRGAKCGCPGECEPRGCDEQRSRQFEKDVEAETKRARQHEQGSEEKVPDAEAARAPVATRRPPPAHTHARSLTPRERQDL